MNKLFWQFTLDSLFYFPPESLRAALWVSLLSVAVLAGLSYYLNYYSRRPYFTIWTVAWLFYALWLCVPLVAGEPAPGRFGQMLQEWGLSCAAVFLAWGSACFLGLGVSQRLLGLFLCFLLVWGYIGIYHLTSLLQARLPIFGLIGAASLGVAASYLRIRRQEPRYLGAGLLAAGFCGWGVYLMGFPFLQPAPQLQSAMFFGAAVLQLFLAVSMIVLVLEEARLSQERAEQELEQQRSVRETLEAQQKALEDKFLRVQRLDSIGTLAGGIAHDLNNILAPNLMAVQLLRDKNCDPRSQNLLVSMETSTRRGMGMLRQLLTFGRGRTSGPRLLSARALVEESALLIRETFPKSIVLQTTVLDRPWPILGDQTQLMQVLLNLCLNARDAMPEGGILTLKVAGREVDEAYVRRHPEARPGSYVVLSVRDTGAGIPSGIRERLFEPFFTTKEPGKGTGLGLSTALRIVQAHGGFILVSGEQGGGAEFRVFLPLAREANHEAEKTPERASPSGQGNLILVVEDEAALRSAIEMTLERNGYRVVSASNAHEALEIYGRRRADIAGVLTDLLLPGLDGTAFIRELHVINPQIQVIVMSSRSCPAEVPALGPNVHSHLCKPFTPAELLSALHAMVTSPPPASLAG